MVLVRPGALPRRRVVECQQPALTAGGDDLVLTERERCGMTETTDGSTVDRRAIRLCAVLDDDQVMLGSERHDGRHVGWPAGKVDDDQGTGSRREAGTERLGRDVLTVAVDIGHDGRGSSHDRSAGRSDERPARRDDLVAWTDAERVEGELQRKRTVGQGDGVSPIERGSVLALEGPALLTRPIVHATGAQDPRRGLDLVFTVAWPRSELDGRRVRENLGTRVLSST